DNDHICKSCNCCWSFKQTAAVPPPQKSVGVQQQQPAGNDEQKFAPYFAAAIKKIDDLESHVLKSKIEIVKVLAEELEKAGFPLERIANEIVHHLKGRIYPTYIRRNLDDKHKDKCHSANAKKQKVATHVSRDKPKQITSSPNDEAEVPNATDSFENYESIEN